MAEYVQLIVKVDKSQLSSLQTEINKLNGTTIDLKVNSSSVGKAANDVAGVSTEFKSAEESARYFQLRGLTPLEKELNQTAKEAKNAAKQTESLWDNFQKFARWYIVCNAFIAIKRSMTDALDTLKAVDDELVTVRKVTGFDDAQIQRLKRQAFEVASAYGETADAYLESVAAFSRAGYKEQSAALAELSTKTQIVGDTTAEIANQFLLSVDAAYKYQGSIEKLSRVLDGANEIDNKYATSIEKIAQGMGIVAPVAEQMHVDVNELAAAIGTITAVTQRSGNEAARALRALFLNIVGDTKTEIEEGVTWTTGEIAGLRDVIKTYAPEAYKAAEATGKIIDPMEAIGGLAKSMKENLLTEQELMEMVSDIGGKLRTSQLLALIQNWDMYQSMMADYANALGSADKEVENALDSWTRKTNILKNTWAEFVSHLIDSKEIKAGIDILTAFVRILDNGVVKVLVYEGAILGLIKAFSMLSNTNFAWAIRFIGLVSDGTSVTFSLIAALQTLGEMLTGPTGFLVAALMSAALAIKLAEDQTHTYEEQAEVLKDLQAEYDTLASKAEALTDAEKKRLTVLEDQLAMAKQIAVKNWNDQQYGVVHGASVGAFGEYRSGKDDTAKQVQEVRDAYRDLIDEYSRATDAAGEYNVKVRDLAESLETSVEAIRLKQEVGEDLTLSEQQLLSLYDELTRQITVYSEETVVAASNVDIFSQAIEEMDRMGGMTQQTMEALIAEFPELKDQLTQTEQGWVLSREAIEEHLMALEAQYQTIYNNAASAAQTLVNAEALKKAGIDATTLSIKQQLAAMALLYESQFISRRISEGDSYSDAMRSYNTGGSDEFQAAAKVRAAAAQVGTAASNLSGVQGALAKVRSGGGGGVVSSGGGGGGGRSGGSGSRASAAEKEVDTVLEGLKAKIALEKQRLSLMEASGASAEERVAQMRKIQDLLHKQADHLRQFEGTEKDVLSLSTEWWQVQSKIAKAIEDADDSLEKLEESIKAARDEAIKLLDEEEAAVVGPLQAQLDALEAQRDAIKDARDEEEKRLAVEEARAALENAQNERNIRQYNAATGQWEWVANEQTVASARKGLADAEQALADQQLDRRISELRSRIGAIEDDYDARRDEVEEDAKAKLEGAKTIGEYKKDYAEAKARGDAAGMAAANAGANAVRERLGLDAQYADRDIAAVRGYDSGGILRGLGGIKATRADEMVLPPTMTSSLLEAERNGSFDALLNHLGIVTAAAQQYAGFGSSVSNNRIGTQHNGDAYYFNGMEITNVTENTSMGEFLMKVKTLSLYSGG